jgi:HEAT repeat protein
MRAARTLATWPLRENFTALARALEQDRSAPVRMACAIALAEAFSKKGMAQRGAARKALETATLFDASPHVRRAAVFALGHFGEDGETALLASLDLERSYLVKATALKALAWAKSPQLLAAATEAMDDRGWRDLVPMAALDALAIAQLPEAFDLAYAGVRYGETQEVREAAVRLLTALAQSKSARKARPEQARHVVPTIATLLQDPSVFVKLAAAGAAGKLGDKALLAPLRRLVRDEVWDHLVHTAEKAIADIRKHKQPARSKLKPPRA